eukprot:211075_1
MSSLNLAVDGKSTSHKVINDYVNNLKSHQDYAPDVVVEIIIKYLNCFFVLIKSTLDDEEKGHIMPIDKDMNFRKILKLFDTKIIDQVENTMEYKSCKRILYDMGSKNIYHSQYPVFTRLWVRFFAIKVIYPYKRKTKRKGTRRRYNPDRLSDETDLDELDDMEMKDIDKVNKDDNRFVEIPDDYYWKIKIKKVMERIDPNSILEIVVEKYDKKNQFWPFQKKINDSKKSEKWRNNIQIGDILDVKQKKEYWFQSFVRYIELKELSIDSIKLIMDGITSINDNKLKERKVKLYNDSLSVGDTKAIYIHMMGTKKVIDHCRKFEAHDLAHVAKRNTHASLPYRCRRNTSWVPVPNLFRTFEDIESDGFDSF